MTHPNIVPVILVKNDEYWLPYCLSSAIPHFDRVVIYDIGSTDRTPEIIEFYIDLYKGDTDFFYRALPHVDPKIQGIFRNSMIAEARSDWYLILDADEIYTDSSFNAIHHEARYLEYLRNTTNPNILYGIVPRVEIAADLTQAYGQDRSVSHHRLYHRTAIFKGPHPGEEPFYKQKHPREEWLNNITCFHFHNTARSSRDEEVPSRIRRRSKQTYHPGELSPIDLFKELPILRHRIPGFPVNPVLEKLQSDSV